MKKIRYYLTMVYDVLLIAVRELFRRKRRRQVVTPATPPIPDSRFIEDEELCDESLPLNRCGR